MLPAGERMSPATYSVLKFTKMGRKLHQKEFQKFAKKIKIKIVQTQSFDVGGVKIESACAKLRLG